MLQWNSLYPYNAVHIARLPGRLCAERLQHEALRTLNRLGLSRLTLGADQRTVEFGTGTEAPEVCVLGREAPDASALWPEVEAQLNRPFPDGPCFCPFRFFVAPGRGESFWLGLTYFHPVADADAVVRVMQSLAAALGGREDAFSAAGQKPETDRAVRVLARHPGALLHKLLCLPAQLRALRRFCRPRYRDMADLRVGVAGSCLHAPELELMMAAAQRWGVTINDLLLAMLLRALATLAVGRLKAPRRRRLAVGCIASLRPALAEAERHRFGLYLGMFVVSHEVPPELGLGTLAREVRRQTLFIKRRKLYLATPVDLALARGLMTFFSPERRRTFYPKHHPLWGGLTNMNLNTLGPATAAGAPLDYWRAVATGPVAPLILSATTIRDHLNLSWSYRTGALTGAEIEAVQRRFADQLADLRNEL